MKESARKQIYLRQASRALLRELAATRHGGNESAAIEAALQLYAVADPLARQALITDAVLALATAQVPDERFDPADDNRAEGPTVLLAGLLDPDAAAGIATALSVLWTRWVLEGKGL